MATINFDLLVTKSDWAGALHTLLAESETAVRRNDAAKNAELRGQLKTFIKRSPSMADFFDDIALKSVEALALDQIDKSLGAILALKDELEGAIATIEKATDKAEKDAKANQLKTVVEILDRAKSAVETLKELEKKLDTPDQNLLARIATVSAAIQDLVNQAKKPLG